jgi:hypothetical protein
LFSSYNSDCFQLFYVCGHGPMSVYTNCCLVTYDLVFLVRHWYFIDPRMKISTVLFFLVMQIAFVSSYYGCFLHLFGSFLVVHHWQVYIFLWMGSTNKSTKCAIFRVGECKYSSTVIIWHCFMFMYDFSVPVFHQSPLLLPHSGISYIF